MQLLTYACIYVKFFCCIHPTMKLISHKLLHVCTCARLVSWLAFSSEIYQFHTSSKHILICLYTYQVQFILLVYIIIHNTYINKLVFFSWKLWLSISILYLENTYILTRLLYEYAYVYFLMQILQIFLFGCKSRRNFEGDIIIQNIKLRFTL